MRDSRGVVYLLKSKLNFDCVGGDFGPLASNDLMPVGRRTSIQELRDSHLGH